MGEVTGTGVLTAETLQLIQQGFADLGATVKQVLSVAIPSAVGVIGISAGANYALGKLRGILGWA